VVDVDGDQGAALVAAGVRERAISGCPMLTSTIQLRCLAALLLLPRCQGACGSEIWRPVATSIR
jgi:hypothetical protein